MVTPYYFADTHFDTKVSQSILGKNKRLTAFDVYIDELLVQWKPLQHHPGMNCHCQSARSPSTNMFYTTATGGVA